MLSKKLEEALNDQVQAEWYSGYLYLAMSSYFESQNLSGMAAWMNAQFKEELIHAMKFYYYIIERGGRALLKEIKAPPVEWDSPQAAFEAALKHEQYITSRIYKLVELAQEEKDFATLSFLQWYVDEQVEEEASAEENLKKLELLAQAPGGVYMVDKELGARPAPFVLPTAETPGGSE